MTQFYRFIAWSATFKANIAHKLHWKWGEDINRGVAKWAKKRLK